MAIFTQSIQSGSRIFQLYISDAVSGINHPFYGKEHNSKSLKLMQTNSFRRKLEQEDVDNIRRLHESGVSQTELANHYNVTKQTINDIIKRRSWKLF